MLLNFNQNFADRVFQKHFSPFSANVSRGTIDFPGYPAAFVYRAVFVY